MAETGRSAGGRYVPGRSDSGRSIPDRIPERGDLDPEVLPPQERRTERLAQIGLLVGAGVLLARKGVFTRPLHAIGRRAAGLSERAAPFRGALDELVYGTGGSATRRLHGVYTEGGVRKIAEPDIVRDTERILRDLGAIGNDEAFQYDSGRRTISDISRSAFERAYGGQRAPKGLAAVTVADLLAPNSPLQAQFSKNTIEMLSRGRAAGFVSSEMRLSRSGAFGIFRDAKGQVLDTQWASLDRLLQRAHEGSRGFRFGDFHPADLIFGVVRPWVHRPISASIGGGKILPGGVKTGRLLNVAIGDDVFSLVEGRREFRKIASGLRIHDATIPGGHYLARQAEAISGQLGSAMGQDLRVMAKNKARPFARFWASTQIAAGVGPGYQTERSVFGRLKDFFVRARRGRFKPYEYSPRGEQTNAFGRGAIKVDHGDLADDVLAEAVRNRNKANWSQLTWWEKVKVYAGTSRHGQMLVGGKPIGIPRNPPRTSQGRTPFIPGARIPVGDEGLPALSAKASGVALAPGSAPHIILHHLSERLNTLTGATFGVGIRPTAGKWGWAGNLAKLYGFFQAGKMGLEYAKYADYQVEDTFGFSPSKLAVQAYAQGMVLRQELREAAGISPAARYVEGLMPGSTSLPASWLARTVAPMAVGAFKGGRTGAAAGAALSFLVGGADVGQDPDDLRRVYSGDKLVPVRKGRWWVGGLTPWQGGRVDYYRPHGVARFMGDPRYTDSQYGSKDEYFAYKSEALTPTNWFGLRKVMNPEYFSQKHYQRRPYPYSETGQRMHQGEDLLPTASPEAMMSAGLGEEASRGAFMMGEDPGKLTSRMSRGLDQITELGGIYKFFAESLPFYEDVFGVGRGGSNKYAASASTIGSATREYYDEELGGLLGLSEEPRRIMGVDRGEQGINRIPNQMPRFLPGIRSEFERDRTSPIDLTVGDPFARISGGEYRLPGPGYESVRPLHSGIPGSYDSIDALLILADVAPWSEAYQHHKTIVDSWRAAGVVDTSWERRLGEAEQQVSEKLYGGGFTPRIFSGTRSGTLQELARVNEYSGPERVLGAGWEIFTHDVVPNAGRMVPILGTIMDRKLLGQRSALESYKEDQIYGVEWQDWRHPWRSFVRAKMDTLTASHPLTAMAGGAGLGLLMGPTAGVLGALGFGAASSARALATGQATGGYIPNHVEEEQQLLAYFDALQYMRMRRGEEAAGDMGNGSLARQFSKEAARTAIGMGEGAPDELYARMARARMGRHMRPYVRSFLEAPEGSREEISKIAGPLSRPLLENWWGRTGDTRFKYPQESADQRAEQMVAMYGKPDDSWQGWSSSVPQRAIKLRTLDTIKNEAYDMHHFDLWEADKVYVDRVFPDLEPAFASVPLFPLIRMRLKDTVVAQMNPMGLVDSLPTETLDAYRDFVISAEDLVASMGR